MKTLVYSNTFSLLLEKVGDFSKHTHKICVCFSKISVRIIWKTKTLKKNIVIVSYRFFQKMEVFESSKTAKIIRNFVYYSAIFYLKVWIIHIYWQNSTEYCGDYGV